MAERVLAEAQKAAGPLRPATIFYANILHAMILEGQISWGFSLHVGGISPLVTMIPTESKPYARRVLAQRMAMCPRRALVPSVLFQTTVFCAVGKSEELRLGRGRLVAVPHRPGGGPVEHGADKVCRGDPRPSKQGPRLSPPMAPRGVM